MNQLALDYYRQPAPMTDLQGMEELLQDTPRTNPEMVEMIQGLMLHIFWAEREGFKLSKEREEEVQLRPARAYFQRIVELDPAPLTQARPLERKVIGNCRDHSVLLCALLRRLGIPARARAGGGAYFLPDHYEDHWICEYWNEEEQRWVMVDAQLNPFQCEAMQIPFNPLDVPQDQFLTSGRLWLGARAGKVDPEKCGIFDIRGMDYLRWIVGLDFGALNKFEILPWDSWGLFSKEAEAVTTDDLAFLDKLAGQMVEADQHLDTLQSLFQHHPDVSGTAYQRQLMGESAA